MAATDLGPLTIPDAIIGRHFGHHARFESRHPDRVWRFRRVQVPIADLHCGYDDPGVQVTNPAGLMGAVGMAALGYSGMPIVQMARAIESSLKSGKADDANPSLRKVLTFRDGGWSLIGSVSEPLAVTCVDGRWFVREGTHRAVAMALLGEQVLEAIDFESGELQ